MDTPDMKRNARLEAEGPGRGLNETNYLLLQGIISLS
jgi:hypothetical protein